MQTEDGAVQSRAAPPTYSVFPQAQWEAPQRHFVAVASAMPSATAEECDSIIISPGRCHLLLDCPVPPLPWTKEVHLPPPLHTAQVLQAPDPIMTDFLCTFSSFCVFFQSSSSFPNGKAAGSYGIHPNSHALLPRALLSQSGPSLSWCTRLFCPQCRPCPLGLVKLVEVSVGQIHKRVKAPLD